MAVLPELTPENKDFWTGGAEERLMIGRCGACGKSVHPPQPVCPACLSDGVQAHAARGTGKIVARTINRQAWTADMEVPFLLALVELDGEDDVRLTARIATDDLEAVAIGDAVAVDFEADGGIYRPFFRPVGA